MKKITFLALIFGALMTWQSFGENTKPNKWGDIACGVQMSIALKEPANEIKTNQPVNLAISFKNISTNEAPYFVLSSTPTDYSWVVVFPSGKKVVSKELAPKESFATMMVSLNTNEIKTFTFELNSVCSFNEVGIYKVIAKKKILLSGGQKKCEVISNSLSIVVVS